MFKAVIRDHNPEIFGLAMDWNIHRVSMRHVNFQALARVIASNAVLQQFPAVLPLDFENGNRLLWIHLQVK